MRDRRMPIEEESPEQLGYGRTIVGPGHWFEQPRTHFRLGYGWPTLVELHEGLDALDAALAAARTAWGAGRPRGQAPTTKVNVPTSASPSSVISRSSEGS